MVNKSTQRSVDELFGLLSDAESEVEQARKDLQRAVSSYLSDPDWVRMDFILEAAGRYGYWCRRTDQLRKEVERHEEETEEGTPAPF